MLLNSFPSKIKFSKQWRPYQLRILKELEGHLDDNRLHIVAPPGSGKTVLGLEVMLRLNKPTLIFAPTIAIREQWVDRFLDLFSNARELVGELISRDVMEPKLVTVSTYQGLHAAYNNLARSESEEQKCDNEEESLDEVDSCGGKETKSPDKIFLQKLQQAQIGTIIVDEAHHLRSEWWTCLIDVKKKLGQPTIVALTATPPYDVSPVEWERYKNLCGPVDAEISVPELVREKNLCPHQDYIYFSTPLQHEKSEIKQFRDNVDILKKNVCSNVEFIEAVENHPYFTALKENIESILSDPAFYSSIAVFLRHLNREIPKGLLSVLGIPFNKLPKFDLEILEVLLIGCFFTHSEEFGDKQAVFSDVRRDFKRIGAVEHRRVVLRSPTRIGKLLATSLSKLDSISEIVEIESSNLRQDLRMLILTDYIRKEALPKAKDDLLPLTRIGVIPVFEKIRRARFSDVKLGVLSGSLVILPVSAKQALLKLAEDKGINHTSVRLSHLVCDEEFLTVDMLGGNRHSIISVVTELFNQGYITVLVGTKSLLGEGWDAPFINSLILASFVGSFMLSNQMRGRAIRTQEVNPDKTANIWHLVCVEDGAKYAGDDLEMLRRRFKAFVGISFKEPVIENGIERMDIGDAPYSGIKIGAINARMRQMALDRYGLIDSWEKILATGTEVAGMVEQIRTLPVSLPRGFVFYNTILALFWQGVFIGGSILRMYLDGMQRNMYKYNLSFPQYIRMLGIGFLIASLFVMPNTIRALYLFIKHGPVSSSIKQIVTALLKTMCYASLIKTPFSKLDIKAEVNKYGIVCCSLIGATTYENAVFSDALKEILGPIGNPRYILVRKTFLGRLLRQDYHVVPYELARNKKYAEYFAKMWAKYVGPTKLIYTRTIEGRKMLLMARANALSCSFQKKAECVKIWQ